MHATSTLLLSVVLASAAALSACGGGNSVTVPLGVTSNTNTSPALAASAMETQANALFAHARSLNIDDPEDDENVWELVAEAWTLVAQAARIRAEAATADGNTEAAEAWTLAAEAAVGYTQVARALASETTTNTEPDTAIGPQLLPPLTTVERNGKIATSFGTTKLDYYPLDARNVTELREPPKLPGPPELPEPPQPPQLPELTALPNPPTLTGLPELPEPPQPSELMTGWTELPAPYPCGEYDHPDTCKFFWDGEDKWISRILAEHKENLAYYEQNYKAAIVTYKDGLALYELYYNADLAAYKDALAAHEQSYKAAFVAYKEALALYEQRAAEHSEELSQYSQTLSQYSEALSRYQQPMDQYHVWRMVEAPSEIASREQVLAMLRENVHTVLGSAADQVHGLLVHAQPPVVRFDSGKGTPTPQERSEALRAIDNINAWFPYEKHITVGPDANITVLQTKIDSAVDNLDLDNPSTVEELRLAHDTYEPAGTINAFFSQNDVCGGGVSALVTFGKGCGVTPIIQHELLHALGLGGGIACQRTFGGACNWSSGSGPMLYYSHAPVADFPESEMAYASPYDDTHGLSQIDGEVLQSIYVLLHGSLSKYEDVLRDHGGFEITETDKGLGVITVDKISPESLGPWDDTVIRYSGSVENWPYSGGLNRADFGVDWRNGMARPWTVGSLPHGTFAESNLSGTATWNGNLVGFTPAKEAVHGDSAINVDLATMTGNAAFTALEHWTAGTPPGARGGGAQWHDGDLEYTLALDGNYLRSNGGDEGYVSGRFVGAEHEGAVGILERPDLTGAFGAVRDE